MATAQTIDRSENIGAIASARASRLLRPACDHCAIAIVLIFLWF
jgi:hypothetical protein